MPEFHVNANDLSMVLRFEAYVITGGRSLGLFYYECT